MNYKETFAQRLIDLREQKNITQQELADELGITRQSLSLYEKAERTINIELLAKIADFFNVSTDYLMGRTNTATLDESIQTACKVTGLSEKAINNITSFKLYHDFPIVFHDMALQLVMNSVVDEVGFICDFLESDEFSELFRTLEKAVANKIAAYIESEFFPEQNKYGTRKSLDKSITYNGHYPEISKAYTIDSYYILKNFIDNYVEEFKEDFQKKIHNNSEQKESDENG